MWRRERIRALFRRKVIWERELETDAALITEVDEEIEFSIEEDGALLLLAMMTEEPGGLEGNPSLSRTRSGSTEMKMGASPHVLSTSSQPSRSPSVTRQLALLLPQRSDISSR